MSHLVLDSDDQRRWQQEDARESAVERRQRLLAQELENHAVTVAPDDGHDVSNLMAQIGRPLSCHEVIDKLKKCNSRLYFERSKADPTKMGVYLHDPTGVVYVNPQGETVVIKHLFGMESGVMPEFSVRHTTKTRVANQELFGKKEPVAEIEWKVVDTFLSETRGWRSVLVRLLHAGLITRHDVETHFGWSPSRDSKNWHDQTR